MFFLPMMLALQMAKDENLRHTMWNTVLNGLLIKIPPVPVHGYLITGLIQLNGFKAIDDTTFQLKLIKSFSIYTRYFKYAVLLHHSQRSGGKI